MTDDELDTLIELVAAAGHHTYQHGHREASSWFNSFGLQLSAWQDRRSPGEVLPLASCLPEATTELPVDSEFHYVMRVVQATRDEPGHEGAVADVFHELLLALADAREADRHAARNVLELLHRSPQELAETGELTEDGPFREAVP